VKLAAIRSLLVGKRPVNTGDGVRGTGGIIRGGLRISRAARSRNERGGEEPGVGTYGS
jgi:hypothetical protein